MINLKNTLFEKKLKVTPQRLKVLEAVYNISHPTAEDVIKYIRKRYFDIATGTVYKILETFVEKGLIKKITTDKDIIRYDGILKPHHHLYSLEGNLIKDYIDEELDKILQEYFKHKKISDFEITEISLQIKGKFNK